MTIKTLINGLHRRYKYLIETPCRMRSVSDSKKKKEQILNEKKNRKNKKIKVGFIVQMPEVWDKEAPLFDAMLVDDRFYLYLIIVPHYDFTNSKLERYGEEKKYFTRKYPDVKTLLLKDENDMVVDDSFDYIFYQRCWENYLPEQLRCKNVINYAMTCYIPYCYHCTPMVVSYYKTDFFWYLNKFYCCSEDQYKQVKKIGDIECQYLGFPVIDSLCYEDTRNKKFNILWTPRWSDDRSLGGTSFNTNKYNILNLSKKFERVLLTMRPHPLTFENAIKQKWMTETEVEEYRELVKESGAVFDDNKLIEDTFNSTDILITDFSSVIMTFFLSGRPIIYCAGKDFAMTETFREIINSLYIATKWEDVQRIVRDLMDGKDPLYEKRQMIIHRIDRTKSSVNNIIEDLYEQIRS